jgi:hypothetical protein
MKKFDVQGRYNRQIATHDNSIEQAKWAIYEE